MTFMKNLKDKALRPSNVIGKDNSSNVNGLLIPTNLNNRSLFINIRSKSSDFLKPAHLMTN